MNNFYKLGIIIMALQTAHPTTATSLEMNKAVTVTYTNWRAETAERTIIPLELVWGKTEWHPEEQWLLRVWDIDRNAERLYALKDIKQWK